MNGETIVSIIYPYPQCCSDIFIWRIACCSVHRLCHVAVKLVLCLRRSVSRWARNHLLFVGSHLHLNRRRPHVVPRYRLLLCSYNYLWLIPVALHFIFVFIFILKLYSRVVQQRRELLVNFHMQSNRSSVTPDFDAINRRHFYLCATCSQCEKLALESGIRFVALVSGLCVMGLTVHTRASVFSWWRGTVVERRSLAGELSLSCTRPASDDWPVIWVNRLL